MKTNKYKPRKKEIVDNKKVIFQCRQLLEAYREGKLGNMRMPEDSNPKISDEELRLVYFTLPMSLNYQRDSYKLWEAALAAYNDKETRVVFDVKVVAKMPEEKLRLLLTKYKVALQPNKHIATWKKICETISKNFGTIKHMIECADYDYLKLRDLIQVKHKAGFPYISGPKIFNYWCFILQEYGKIKLKNSEYIEIAPDTHVTQCSVKLGVISQDEAMYLSKEKISQIWRETLKGTGINPIDMHPPLWFWSRNGFRYKIEK